MASVVARTSSRLLSWIAPAFTLVLATPAWAQFSTVDPLSLDLTLGSGDMVTEMVSITILPFCIVPVEIDVAASDPGANVVNLSGIQVNGCGGDTTQFAVEFTGTGAPQAFDLQFIDAGSGPVIDSIPVTIAVPEPTPLALLVLGLAAVAQATRRPPGSADSGNRG